MNFTPRDYQVEMSDKIKAGESVFVIAKAGSGKTAATLYGLTGKTLIVAPLRVALHTWPAEIEKWGFGYSYAVAIGTPAQRNKAIASDPDVLIINIDNLVWLLDNYEVKIDTLVIDESSMLKSPSTKRFKKLRNWRKTNHCQIVLLTATPTPNSLLEAWPQMFMLDYGDRLGKTFTAYRDRYFVSDYMGYKWEPRPKADEKIHGLISEVAVVVESYSGLPDLVEVYEEVTMPAKVRKLYDQMKKEMLIETDGSDISAVNAAVMVNKLAQFASGAIYHEDGSYSLQHDEKIDALEDLILRAGDESLLVAYNYKHELERIKARFPHAVSIKEKGAIDRWNRGEIKLLLAHPKSAGHGLNLQAGGRRIVWFTPTWSNELKIQFDARLFRQGQTGTVFIHTIYCEDSVDWEIIEAVGTKKSIQDLLINSIK